MKKRVTIYIATGKKLENIPPGYKGVYVGNGRLDNMLSDGDGDNIKEKNPYYCELTALYYVWKNEVIGDYVGLAHYRRFFDFDCDNPNAIVETQNSLLDITNNISIDALLSDLDKYDVVLPKADNMCLSVYEHYAKDHNKKDYDIIRNIIKERYPDYLTSFDKISSGNTLHLYNMFIMKKEIFLQYMEWLFSILFEAEKKIDVQVNDQYQRRVFGYLAERLLNVYVYNNNFSIIEKPVIFLQYGNIKDVRIREKDWKYVLKNKMFKLVNITYKIMKG